MLPPQGPRHRIRVESWILVACGYSAAVLGRTPRLTVLLRILVLMLWTWAGTKAHAHGDAHIQIEDLNRQIATNSTHAPLFLRRAELHRLDGNWTNAIADLKQAAVLDPALPGVALEYGRVYFDAGQPERALPPLNDFLKANPSNAIGRLVRARARAWAGQTQPALEDYGVAIQCSRNPGPDLFLERAGVYRGLGKAGLEPALQSLMEGLQSVGPVLSLEMAVMDLEVDLERWDAALKRLDRVALAAPRRDRWLMRRAEVLELAGRKPEAQGSWKEALQEFNALPERLRTSKSGQQQAATLRERVGTP